MKFSTKAIHVGNEPDEATGAVISPIYLTSTFAQEYPSEHKGYDYTRAGNPNFTRAEQQMAALENAKHSVLFSSGIGALTAFLSTLKQGDKVLAMDGLYGGTFRLFNRIFKKFGVEFEILNQRDLHTIDDKLKEKPKLFLFETPTNPLLEVFDIRELTEKARKFGVTTIVDNTFATPYFQNPLDCGADIVWHSCTKYLGGHSDVIGGVMMTNSSDIYEELIFARMSIGVNPSPFDVWMIMRSVKTLALRMERHQSNATAIARFFEGHPSVKKVYYPGLESHKTHDIARKQMSGFSGIVSVEFNLSIEDTKTLISKFKFFQLAESLGGVESLVNHPASMTHASIPEDERKKMGLSDGLVRFSVGVESEEDLLEDLKVGLERFQTSAV
ncbi:MAG: PLP-dependent aspartate aminotransferase family protein [Chlamydiota bacterium]|nr:PLP-dependent aspartate aminotransferase family protein [Chlamydiota bacterium]